MLCRAIRAGLRDRHELPAMMAFEPVPESMLDEPSRAIRTLELEATVAADGNRRITATIEEQQRLLATRQGLSHSLDQHRREPLAALRRGGAHVDGRNGRKARSLVTDAEPDVPVAALLGV